MAKKKICFSVDDKWWEEIRNYAEHKKLSPSALAKTSLAQYMLRYPMIRRKKTKKGTSESPQG